MNLTKFWKVSFWIYIALLINFVVFKFFGNVQDVINMAQDNYRNIHELGGNRTNFIPFRTINSYSSIMDVTSSFINVFGNIIPFIPLGFLIPIVFPSKRKFVKSMIVCLIIILIIEIIQYITYLGSMDIDDVILNQISCIIGYILYLIYIKIKKPHNYEVNPEN
ncbi:VanZ family protein, partial [Bacillus cereus]|uniref:VanZ family protein n=2 Tax=Bacillaceae TaxID=186817 RepID=UPI0007AC13A6